MLTVVEYEVKKNDYVDIQEINSFDKILFSPGPGVPSEAGKMIEIIKAFYNRKSILGICLGHQAIAEVFGGSIYNLPKPLHGIKEEIFVTDNENYLFRNIPSKFYGGLYHSWAVDRNNFPEALKITATNSSGIIMGIAHKFFDVHGLQFHPESVMTPFGKNIIQNWILSSNTTVSDLV